MKKLIIVLLLLTAISGFSQVTRITGKITETSTEIYSKEENPEIKVSYVANSSTIQEFFDYKRASDFSVKSVTFYTDKIFYKVTDVANKIFGITFTFSDRTLFLSDIEGNFVELSGEGLTFCHQY